MEKIKIDDFTRYKYLSGVKHSEDGRHACFVLHETDLEENKYNSNLWIFDVENRKYKQLTSFNSEKSFLWIDNENIIFPDIRDAKDKERKDSGEEFTQYYKININGGEAVKYIRIPRNVNSIKVVDSNTYMFISQYNPKNKDLNLLGEEEKARELKERKEEKDYEVLEEIPFWSNGEGFTNKKRSRLYMFHADTGEIAAVTDESSYVNYFDLNNDKSTAVIIKGSFNDKMEQRNDMMLFDIKSKQLRKITEHECANHYYAGFLSKDTLIFTGTDMKDFGINENEKFYVLDIASDAVKAITPELDVSLANSVGSDCRFGGSDQMQIDDGRLYFVSTEGDSSFINSIDRYGNMEKLTEGDGSVDGISINNGNILMIGMDNSKLQELFSLEGNIRNQITCFNEWVNHEKSISIPEKISVLTEPGIIIDGFFLKPAAFDENKKYPAILDIHGGPKTVYGTVFFHEMQYWANEGYAVFFCNPRGSDGKGNEFADIRVKYGTIDYDDIMKFTDEVIRKYSFIDENRIGVTGGSYGGYMTNWIIGHTDRFRAAASQRSISNWISKFCTTDIGYFFVEDQLSATPWSDQGKLWDYSPLKYADRVKTPTLFLHSDEDYRCWIAEAIQMFTALKYHGVESRLIMFRGENHELSRSGKPKHRLRRLKEITDWFDRYLKSE